MSIIICYKLISLYYVGVICVLLLLNDNVVFVCPAGEEPLRTVALYIVCSYVAIYILSL